MRAPPHKSNIMRPTNCVTDNVRLYPPTASSFRPTHAPSVINKFGRQGEGENSRATSFSSSPFLIRIRLLLCNIFLNTITDLWVIMGLSKGVGRAFFNSNRGEGGCCESSWRVKTREALCSSTVHGPSITRSLRKRGARGDRAEIYDATRKSFRSLSAGPSLPAVHGFTCSPPFIKYEPAVCKESPRERESRQRYPSGLTDFARRQYRWVLSKAEGTEASGYSLLFGWIMDLLKINPL